MAEFKQLSKKKITEEEYGDLEIEEVDEVDEAKDNDEDEKSGEHKRSAKELLKDFLVNLQGVSLTDKIFFIQNLRVMIKSGLSLSRALKTIAIQIPNSYFRKVLNNVSTEVEAGASFAQSLKKYPRVFNDLFISMVESGELSGNIEDVLDKLHTQMKRDHDLIAKVKGAMVYPLVVVIAMFGIGTAMVIFVVPKLISIFEEFQAGLPLPTRVLISLSNFITHNGILVIFLAVIFVVSFAKFARSQPGKKILHKIFLYSPILGKISQKINIARFCRTASSLLKTDIPIVKSLEITSMVVGNVYYKEALRKASEKIAKGMQINQILSENPKLFPPTVIQMIKVGEESGAIDSVLDEIAQFYEEDVNQVMETLPSVIEPILILLLGLGVGAMAVAIIMPIYSLTQTF
ncbi:MAG: type II secretion system F family protein [Candidatus Kuenenbacteria bacterium]